MYHIEENQQQQEESEGLMSQSQKTRKEQKHPRKMSRGNCIGNKYDPSHPEADWSGFVPTKICKKQFSNSTKVPPALKVQVTTVSKDDTAMAAFGPKEDAPTTEWSKPGRRMSTCSPSSSSLKGGRSSTFSLIGGPSPVSPSPSSKSLSSCCGGASHWETESQGMSNQRGTTIDQMTEKGRSVHVRGRRATAPPFANKHERTFDSQRAHVIRNENPYKLNGDHSPMTATLRTRTKEPKGRSSDRSNNGIPDSDPKHLIGYRAKPLMSSSNQSFLSQVAKDLTSSSSFNTKQHRYVSVAPYATDGNLPTDPYASSRSDDTTGRRLSSRSSSKGGTGERTFL